jgi:hypothetical protein
MNSAETILRYLAKQVKEVDRENIQLAVGYANGSLKNALAQLTADGYAVQSKGQYRITQEGREELNSPSRWAFSKAKEKPIANVIDQLMDWDTVQANGFMQQIIKYNFPEDDLAAWRLLPFVLMYMKIKGIKFPEITVEVAVTDEDNKLATIVDQYLDGMETL